MNGGAPREARFYRPELEGLRFIAFLMVFPHHALPRGLDIPSFPGIHPATELLARTGELGVDLFFSLSAYLITVILVLEEKRTERIDVPRFWARRILRIWPLYYSFLALCPWVLSGLGIQTS